MDNIIVLILSAISGIALLYNMFLKKQINDIRTHKIDELHNNIKESKNESKKLDSDLSSLIDEYRKSRKDK